MISLVMNGPKLVRQLPRFFEHESYYLPLRAPRSADVLTLILFGRFLIVRKIFHEEVDFPRVWYLQGRLSPNMHPRNRGVTMRK